MAVTLAARYLHSLLGRLGALRRGAPGAMAVAVCALALPAAALAGLPAVALAALPEEARGHTAPEAAASATTPTLGRTAYLDPLLRSGIEAGDSALDLIVVFRDPQDRAGAAKESPVDNATAAERKAAFARSSPGPMAAIRAAVHAGRAGDLEGLWLINGAAVRADALTARALAARRDVLAVMADRRFPPPPPPSSTAQEDPWNLDAVNAPQVWHALGIDGAGVTVAILDTGVDYHHPALQRKYAGYRREMPDNEGYWWCPRELCGIGALYPADYSGHGTHVLGTILGDGTGVAPGATWIGAVVCNKEECADRWIYAALGWLLEPDKPRAQVVNMSLERRGPTDWVMKDAIDAAARANVFVVAAAGNAGQVYSPGSFTSTITVGAVDDEGAVPIWSGRGLSPWFERKPDVVAPGVGIVSTIPGGGRGTSTGTSMAAPHVAGIAALMLEARTGLNPQEAREILHATSDSSGAVPSPDRGWGNVNAYGAVATLLDVATLEGFVSAVGAAVPHWPATVRADKFDGTPVTSAPVAADGSYRMAVAPEQLIVSASAFGYEAVTRPLALGPGEVRRTDFVLPPRADGGWIIGRATDSDGGPVDGKVVLEGTPAEAPVSAGYFALEGIPPGTYEVRVESAGHRIGHATARLAAGGTVQVDVVLERAPRIMLVDGDAWRFSGAAAYYAASLERLGYLHDDWRVLDPSTGNVPTADDLAAYEIVIWTQDVSSPGYVHAAGNLDAYLQRGGNVILAGQDVACTDSGSAPCAATTARQRYLSDRLLTTFVSDSATSREIQGAPGGPLQGMTLTLGGGDSLDNNVAPDVLDVNDQMRAEVAGTYTGGGGAVTFASTCLGYRAFVLGFGLEGVTHAEQRDGLLDRLISALGAPLEPGIVLSAPTDRQLTAPGSRAVYTITLYNTGPGAVEIAPELTSVWPAELFEAGLGAKLERPIVAASCTAMPFAVVVSVPADTPRATLDVARVAAATGALSDTLELETTTPAPVLLVDGDSFYESDQAYRSGLDALGIKHDVWEVSPSSPSGRSRVPPPYERLALYPVVIWFTGYNPFPTGQLTAETEEDLATYLEAGGRLLFSSEDYLDYRGASFIRERTLFRDQFLGVEQYIQNFGAERLQGVEGTAFESVPACAVRPSGGSQAEWFGDKLYPRPRALGALVGPLGQIMATQYYSGPFKAAFLAFDAGNLEPDCMPAVLGSAVDWFSLVSASRLEADRSAYASGDTVVLEGSVANDGPRPTVARAEWTIPSGATLVAAPPGWAWDQAQRRLSWSGPLAPSTRHDFGASLILDADIPLGARMVTTLRVTDGDGLAVVREAPWLTNVADLETSAKTVVLAEGRTDLEKGESARFTIAVRNRGTVDVERFVVTDTLPAGLELEERTITRPPGTTIVSQDSRGLVWSGSVPRGGEVSLSYDALVVTVQGGTVKNTAVIDPDPGDPLIRSASVLIRPNLLLPWLANKAALPRR